MAHFLKGIGSLFLVCILISPSCLAQEDLSVFGYWKFYEGVPARSLYRHLYGQASMQLAQRQRAIEQLKTKADWQKRQAQVRAKLAEAVGPFPEKTPLHPVITGQLVRDDFRVEKLYFESRPGYYVTAALFLPLNRSGALPAIVYCSGHSANGFRSDVYQHTILNYVKKGFVVLAFDPIGQGERRQYRQSPAYASPTRDHSYAGTYAFVSGISPANYFIWDGIRAIDYLVSRPEVDASRIGMTGRSGGGTQTAYLAALDERIVAAAPECYITTTDKLWQSMGPQDAEQNLMHSLDKGLDLPDLIEVRAPSPTLIVSTTRDIFSIQGVRDTYAEARAAFAAYGQADHLSQVEDDAAHASTPKNREAAYAFFQRHLRNPGSPADRDVTIFREDELFATPTGDVFQDLNSETMFSLNQAHTQDLVRKRNQQRNNRPLDVEELRQRAIGLSGYTDPAQAPSAIFSGRLHRPHYAIEKYLVQGLSAYYVPVLWLKPPQPNGKTVFVLNEKGKNEAVQAGGLADQLARQGYQVLVPDLSGYGELGHGYLASGDAFLDGVPLNLWYAGIQTRQSLVGIRAGEIALLTRFLTSSSPANRPLPAVLATGTLTSDVLHAALFQKSFSHLVLLNPLATYQSITEQAHYQPKFALSTVAGALPYYDLPDLAEAVTDQHLLIINPVDAAGTALDAGTIRTVYAGSLRQASSRSATILSAQEDNTLASTILNWLK